MAKEVDVIIEARQTHFTTDGLVAIQKEYSIHGNQITAVYTRGARVTLGIYEPMSKQDDMSVDFNNYVKLWNMAMRENL